MKDALAILAAIAAAVALVVGGTYGYLHLYRDAAPRFQAAQREVYENTPSYVQGKITSLSRLRADYRRATDDETRETLRDLIATEAATVDHKYLPADIRTFVETL